MAMLYLACSSINSVVWHKCHTTNRRLPYFQLSQANPTDRNENQSQGLRDGAKETHWPSFLVSWICEGQQKIAGRAARAESTRAVEGGTVLGAGGAQGKIAAGRGTEGGEAAGGVVMAGAAEIMPGAGTLYFFS